MDLSKPLNLPLPARLAGIWLFIVSSATGVYSILSGHYGRWVGRSGWAEFVGPQATWAGCMAIAAGAIPLALLMRTRRAAIAWVAFCVLMVIVFGAVLVYNA